MERRLPDRPSLQRRARPGAHYARPVHLLQPTGAVFIYHPGIDSLTGITLTYPCPSSTQFTVDLHSPEQTTRLRVELPRDRRRAGLAYHYDDTYLGADDAPLVTALNQRPEADVFLIQPFMRSRARIPARGVAGIQVPACDATLGDVEDVLRASGLYDADAQVRTTAQRLAPTWRGDISNLHETAIVLIHRPV